jgi:dTDP-4-dehydrorhamnose 3,5-epimerase
MSKFILTNINGLCVIEPMVINDTRGYFFEAWRQSNTENHIWCQENQSHSVHGVIRGLHMQLGEFAQAKLVRCISGKILDVAVDLRPDSPTFKQWYSIILSSKNNLSLLIPRGFAHGFSVLSETADVLYKCDNYYNKSSEFGIYYSDPSLNIDWMLDDNDIKISEKDFMNKYLSDVDVDIFRTY